ncbi:MAG: secretin N-terminal domain-containing protein [Planctomycetota bacterium]
MAATSSSKVSFLAWSGLTILLTWWAGAASARAQPETMLSEKIELPRLIDLSAKRLGLNIQYDAAALRGTLTLRLGQGISDENLWTLTNRLLASKGFATVQMPGEDTLNVVRLNEAAAVARVEEDGIEDAVAGYLKLIVDVEHRAPEELLAPLKQVLSAGGGTATQLGKTQKIVLADLRPHLEQALEMLAFLDVPGEEQLREEIPVEKTSAKELVSLVEKVAATQEAAGGSKLTGKLVALPADRSVLVIAPSSEVPAWRELIARFDQSEMVETRTYVPARFALKDVSTLLEDAVHKVTVTGTVDPWRLIVDELTGSLIITATPSQHDKIEEVLTRLESVATETAVVEEIPTQHVDAATLISLAEKVTSTRATVTGEKLEGKLLAAGSGEILLVAPPKEGPIWRELIERLDRREATTTVSYAAQHFPVRDVATLVEDVARGEGDVRDGWRMVVDELTGTLIISATPSQHDKIQSLIERLDQAAPTSRRPVRSFTIRNRNVTEIAELLNELIGSGVIREQAGEATESGERPDTIALPPPVLEPGEEAAASPGQQSAPNRRRPDVDGEQPPLSLTVDEGTNTLIAIGEVQLLEQIEELLKTLDVRQIQVMLEVMLLELSERDGVDLGLELQRRATDDDVIYQLASLFSLGSPDMQDQDPTTPDGATGFTGLVIDPGRFSVLLRAIQTLSQGRTLNIPKVLVNNNQEAKLDSVLESPFTSVNASNTVATTSFGGTRNAGTIITIRPQIAEGDHLLVEYSLEISSFVGESPDPSLPPRRQQNKLQSVVTVPDSFTIVLGGLETTSETEAISQVPILGSIPLLGELFKSRTRQKTSSRFFAFIRATVLRNEGFEDLKYLSGQDLASGDLDDGFPELEPRLIR